MTYPSLIECRRRDRSRIEERQVMHKPGLKFLRGKLLQKFPKAKE